MKTMRRGVVTVFVAIIIISQFGARAADTNPPPRLTVELRDGSRVVGQSVEKNFKFHSALLGDLKLAVKDIRSVECATTNSAKLTTAGGDMLTVSFVNSDLAVKTSFGKVELGVDSVRKISVAASRPAGGHPPGLVALWSGENHGADSIGGHDAIVPGGITFSTAKVGLGFNFNGAPNRIIVPNAPEINFGPGKCFSIIGWIQPLPPPPGTTDDIMSFVDKRDTPNNFQCQGYEFNLWGGKVHCRLSDSLAGNGGDWGPAGPDLRDGNFHHVALTVVRDSANGGRMYVDGQLVLTFDPTGVAGDLSNNQTLRIGNHPDSNYQCFFHGIIDEVAIYNRALSAAEISADFEAGNKN